MAACCGAAAPARTSTEAGPIIAGEPTGVVHHVTVSLPVLGLDVGSRHWVTGTLADVLIGSHALEVI
jgi:hypothetical protein